MIVSMMLTLVVPILSLIQNSLHTTTTAALVGVLLVLIAGTVLAVTTHSLLWLITGRVLQGAATAILRLALSVLREEIRPQRRLTPRACGHPSVAGPRHPQSAAQLGPAS
jgi:MFS family permease